MKINSSSQLVLGTFGWHQILYVLTLFYIKRLSEIVKN